MMYINYYGYILLSSEREKFHFEYLSCDDNKIQYHCEIDIYRFPIVYSRLVANRLRNSNRRDAIR